MGVFLHLSTTPWDVLRCVCLHLKGYFAYFSSQFWLNDYWITQWMLCFFPQSYWQRSLLWWQILHHQRSLQIRGGQDCTSANVNRGLPCTPQLSNWHARKSLPLETDTRGYLYELEYNEEDLNRIEGELPSQCVFWCEYINFKCQSLYNDQKMLGILWHMMKNCIQSCKNKFGVSENPSNQPRKIF